MTQKKHIAKTLLSVYPQLDGFIRYQHKFMNELIKESFHGFTSAEEIISDVTDRLVKRDQLKFIESMTKKTLRSMPHEQGKILWSFFIKNKSKDELAAELGINPRTVYKQIDKALDIFVRVLQRHEMNATVFNQINRALSLVI